MQSIARCPSCDGGKSLPRSAVAKTTGQRTVVSCAVCKRIVPTGEKRDRLFQRAWFESEWRLGE